jgi:SAM-dependent methyltransferase
MTFNEVPSGYDTVTEFSDGDRAGEQYWTSAWVAHELPSAIDPFGRSRSNRIKRALHLEFGLIFRAVLPSDRRLVEVGCARSAWLAYFAKYHGCSLGGVDYSEVGCEQARQMLGREALEGDIAHADLFDPPTRFVGSFDFVVSFGVAEHFQDTDRCIEAMARLLRPGGVMFTLIPNMCGVVGVTQRLVDRSVSDIHLRLDREQLDDAHRGAGLKVDECFYLSTLNFGVCNVNGHRYRSWGWWRGKILLRIADAVSRPIAWLFDSSSQRSESKWLSSYVICVAKKLPA